VRIGPVGKLVKLQQKKYKANALRAIFPLDQFDSANKLICFADSLIDNALIINGGAQMQFFPIFVCVCRAFFFKKKSTMQICINF